MHLGIIYAKAVTGIAVFCICCRNWERYFTALLQHITENDPVKRYTKVKLLPFYSTGKIREAILSVMSEEIRNLATEK